MTGVIAAGIMIAATLAFVLYRNLRRAPASSADLEFTRVTGSGDVQRADISPDGKYMAYARETGGKRSLWLKQLATDSDVQIAGLGGDYCPGVAFSPDGSYVYFVRQDPLKHNGDLYQVPSLGGSSRKVLAGIAGPPAFSPDGQRVAFVRGAGDANDEDTLLTASLNGSGERVLASYKAPEQIDGDHAAWSPDGKTLAFIHSSPQRVLTTVAAEGGPAQPVAGAQRLEIYDLVWLPGSRHLLVVSVQSGSFQLYEVSLDGGETRQITHDLSRYRGARASADGKTLVTLQEQALFSLQVAMPGKELEIRTLSARNQNRDGWNGLAWAPDGKIVYTSVHNGRYDLWEMGADGSNPRRLTTNESSASLSLYPALSHLGSFIAFLQEDPNGQHSIWRMDRDGTDLKRLTEGQAPAISPDGQWLVFGARGGNSTLMKIPSGGGAASQVTDYDSAPDGYPVSVSPDGKWIACDYVTAGQPDSLAMVPFAGGKPAKLFPLPGTARRLFVWTPDGHAISFIDAVNGVDNIWEQPVVGGPPKLLTHFTSDQIVWFAWSRDDRLALSRGTDTTDAVLIKNFQ